MKPRLSIRARVTATATVVVAITLLLAGAALVGLVRWSLIHAIDQESQARAAAVAALTAAGTPPRTLPSVGQENSLVQIVDAVGGVIASTGNIEGEAPLQVGAPAASSAPRFETVNHLPLGGGRFRLLVTPVTVRGQQDHIYVATSLHQADAATADLALLFASGLPVTVLLLGWIVWRALAGALHPVEQIREQTARIQASTLTDRVPVPPTNDEISRLATTMNTMLQRLEAASRQQQEFVGNASHELKSPLTALQTHLEVALVAPSDAQTARILRIAHEQTQRMATMIEDLLFLAQAHEHRQSPASEEVDLDEILLAEVARLRDQHGPAVNIGSLAAVRIAGSRRALARLLRNLGDNALHYAETTVTLAMHAAAGRVTITVTDDGPGIPAADRTRVFDRFTRLDAARRRNTDGTGTGLGLAIAREIAETHGGTLTLTDPPGGASGITVVLTLPVPNRAADPAKAPAGEAPETSRQRP